MGTEAIIGLIAGLLALVPIIYKAIQSRKANRNEIGKVETAELREGMDKVDAATAPPPDPPRV